MKLALIATLHQMKLQMSQQTRGGNSDVNNDVMIAPQMNQNFNHSQSEGNTLSIHNDNSSMSNNDNGIYPHLGNNNFYSIKADSMINQKIMRQKMMITRVLD